MPLGPFAATLPDPITLVGRDGDLERVLTALDAGQRLVTISGPGGVGKTRVAIEVGHRLWHHQPGSVLFVALTFVTEAERVAEAIATAAGWPVSDGSSAIAQIGERLAGQPNTVVLDNCEQISALGNVVAELLRAWPTTTLIATSRRALALGAEQIVEVAPLALPNPDAPWREIAGNPAVTALVATVRRRVPDYRVGRTNAAAFARLCIRLDGLPLALELAAARLHLVNPAELLTLLDRRFAVLSTTEPDPDPDRSPHHRQLWTAIDWSYRLLDAPVRAQFRRLATFAGGFTLDAAAQVMQTDVITALDTITELCEHHLVRPAGERAGTSRFEMLESIREFAHAALVAEREVDDARAAHASWATRTAQQLQAEINGSEQERVITAFDAERDNFRGALQWQIATNDGGALRLAHGQWQYWFVRGAAREGLRWLHAALDAAGAETDDATARALLGAGNLHDSLGELGAAAALCERAVETFAGLGDRLRMASTWHTLAAITRELGNLDRAWQLECDALAVFEDLDEHRNRAVALNGLGAIAYRRNEASEALRLFLRAAELFDSLGDRVSLAQTFDRIGLAQLMLGDSAEAVRSHRRAQAIGEELDDVPTTVYAMVNGGAALLAAGDAAGAAEVHARAVQLTEQNDDAKAAAHLSRLAGEIADHRGSIGRAVGNHVAALDGFLRLGLAVEAVEAIERLAVLVEELEASGIAATCRALARLGRDATGTSTSVVSVDDAVRSADSPPPGADTATAWATAVRALLDDLGPFAVEHAMTLRGAPDDPLIELGLTPREAEVARLVVARRTDQEIADELFVAVRTASTHVSAVLRKLGVSSRREVAGRLARLGA